MIRKNILPFWHNGGYCFGRPLIVKHRAKPESAPESRRIKNIGNKNRTIICLDENLALSLQLDSLRILFDKTKISYYD